jgi:hypothetical protein
MSGSIILTVYSYDVSSQCTGSNTVLVFTNGVCSTGLADVGASGDTFRYTVISYPESAVLVQYNQFASGQNCAESALVKGPNYCVVNECLSAGKQCLLTNANTVEYKSWATPTQICNSSMPASSESFVNNVCGGISGPHMKFSWSSNGQSLTASLTNSLTNSTDSTDPSTNSPSLSNDAMTNHSFKGVVICLTLVFQFVFQFLI